MSASPYQLEDSQWVERCHQILRNDPGPALAEAARQRARYESQGISLIDWVGWPLRPLFVPRRQLEFLSSVIWRQLDATRQALLERAQEPERVAEISPLPVAFLKALDLADGLSCPWFLSTIRPDGFLYEDRFVLSELNCGNGSLVSNAYQEVLYHHLSSSPVLRAMGADPEAGFTRSFQALLDLIESHLEGDRTLGMLAHHQEWATIRSWHPRVIQQVHHARLLLAERGVQTQLLSERDLKISRFGKCATRKGKHLGGLLLVTLATTLIHEPQRLEQELAFLRGSRAANLPILKPLATLLLDKSTMPWMEQNLNWPCRDGDFEVSLVPTRFPRPEEATELRLGKAEYVLKRSYDGKHTLLGNACPGREWNRTLEVATRSQDYVLQPRLRLPRCLMPVSKDGQTVEWVEMMIEISPFIVQGRFCGAMARYAPFNEGVILSPPPDDMGMTLVYAVP